MGNSQEVDGSLEEVNFCLVEWEGIKVFGAIYNLAEGLN
jgi:hypothetical protein